MSEEKERSESLTTEASEKMGKILELEAAAVNLKETSDNEIFALKEQQSILQVYIFFNFLNLNKQNKYK